MHDGNHGDHNDACLTAPMLDLSLMGSRGYDMNAARLNCERQKHKPVIYNDSGGCRRGVTNSLAGLISVWLARCDSNTSSSYFSTRINRSDGQSSAVYSLFTIRASYSWVQRRIVLWVSSPLKSASACI